MVVTLSSAPPQTWEQNSAGPQKWEDPTTLKARAKKEKSKGRSKVTLPGPLMEYPEGVGLETALSETSVLEGEVISKTSRVLDSHTIGTFYRIKVINILTMGTDAGCCTPTNSDFPADLGPVAEGEMMVFGNGGSALIEGVEVTVEEELAGLVPGRRVLLFSSPTASRKFAVLKLGPSGAFEIKGNGDLEPLAGKPGKLYRELKEKYGNSLPRLRAHLAQGNAPRH